MSRVCWDTCSIFLAGTENNRIDSYLRRFETTLEQRHGNGRAEIHSFVMSSGESPGRGRYLVQVDSR